MFTESYQESLLSQLVYIEWVLEDAHNEPRKLDESLLLILEFWERIQWALRGDRLSNNFLFQTSTILAEIMSGLKEVYIQETYSRIEIFLSRIRTILDPRWKPDIPTPIELDDVWYDFYTSNLVATIENIVLLRNRCQNMIPDKKAFVQLLRQYTFLKLLIESLVRRFPLSTNLPNAMKIPKKADLETLYTYLHTWDRRGTELMLEMITLLLESSMWIEQFIASK
jgi:hypothetical protein